MVGVRWARTEVHVKIRGGASATGYTDEQMSGGPNIDYADVTLWENLEHFLREVIPVAEEAGVKLNHHPMDPPIYLVHGIRRLANNAEAYDRFLDIVDNEHNGVTFCQENFAARGIDISETIHHFVDQINFAHFHDVEGKADDFVETGYNDEPTDMLAAMQAFEDVRFDGPMRPDHVPTMAGEDNSNPGYQTKGRLFAIDYRRGLLKQTTANREGTGDYETMVNPETTAD